MIFDYRYEKIDRSINRVRNNRKEKSSIGRSLNRFFNSPINTAIITILMRFLDLTLSNFINSRRIDKNSNFI